MIEQDVREILFDDDKCANSHLDPDGTNSFLFSYDHEAKIVVYLMELRSDLHYCTLCVKFVGSKHQVKEHMKNHSFYKKLKALEANFEEEEMEENSLDVQMKPAKFFLRTWKSKNCHFCGKKYENPSAKMRHYRRCKQNPLPPFRCYICSYYSLKYIELEAHLRSHDAQKARKERNFEFKCHRCGESYGNSSNRNRHLKFSCKKKPKSIRFKCELCEKDFSRQEHLRRHMKAKHKP